MMPRMFRTLLLSSVLAVPSLAYSMNYGELLDAVPAPPLTVEEARKWVKDAEVVAPQILGTQIRLQSARQELESGEAAVPTITSVESSTAVDDALAAWEGYRSESEGQLAIAAFEERADWLLNRFAVLQKQSSDPGHALHMREQELSAYVSLFKEWKQKRSPVVWLAQSKLTAAHRSDGAVEEEKAEALRAFASALLSESEALLGLTRLAAERANGLSEPEIKTAPGEQPNTLWDLMKNKPVED